MRRTIVTITSLVAFLCISLGISIFLNSRYPELLFHLKDAKYLWIGEKIFSTEDRVVDYVIIGSSHVWCAIKPSIIEAAFPGTLVWNFGRNWDGRDMDYVLIKHLLDRKKVKYIILETSAPEADGSHEYAPYFLSYSDILKEFPIRLRLLKNEGAQILSSQTSGGKNLKFILSCWAGCILRGPAKLIQNLFINDRNTFLTDIRENEKTGGFYTADSKLTAAKALNPEGGQLKEYLRPDVSTPLKNTISDLYLQKIKTLADQKGTKLIFVHLPIPFSSPRLLSKRYYRYYKKMGDVFIPEFNAIHRPEYMSDNTHFFGPGADAVTMSIVNFLKRGAETSRYAPFFTDPDDEDIPKGDLDSLFRSDSLIRNGSFETWPEGPDRAPAFWSGAEGIRMDRQEARVGITCAQIRGDNFNLSQFVEQPEQLRSGKITCFAWIRTDVPNKYRIQIYDGIGASFSDKHCGDGEWHLLRATHNVDGKADRIEIRSIQAARTGNTRDTVKIDGVLVVRGEYSSLMEYSANQRSVMRAESATTEHRTRR